MCYSHLAWRRKKRRETEEIEGVGRGRGGRRGGRRRGDSDE